MAVSDAFPSIPEWYRGRAIFITGGSGFMGKVLVEKLLRSCPDLDTVYLLLRPKKGKEPAARVKDLTDVALFDRLKREDPSSLQKIVPISGDVKELGLGLSDEDRHLLQSEVSVIFHCAASVRFDDPIRDAVLINVRGTLEVINLALGMDKLKVFLHLSTTYCNCDQPLVLEEVYPAPGDWRTMISIVEQDEDDHMLRCLTPKILGTLPNTYTYAKALGEHVIKDHQDRLPVVIVRPSIVLSTMTEPMPGWIDNFNGPVGLMVGGGKGVLRSVYADPNNTGDYVPVDVAIKSLIFIAWQRAVAASSADVPRPLPVYNCSSMTVPTTLQQIINGNVALADSYPLENIFWYPNPTITFNRHTHFLKVIVYHMLPALLIDGLLSLAGKKTILTKLQRRIFIANMTLSIFTTKNNYFSNTRFRELEDNFMTAADRKDFSYNKVITDRYPFMKTCLVGARLYLLKEPLSSLPHALRNYSRMYWLDRICKTLLLLGFLWLTSLCPLVRSLCHHVTELPQYLLHLVE